MDKPTTLRLPKEQAEALSSLAARLGVSDAAIIRWAVDALLQYAEAHGGHLVLPLDLTQQWVRILRSAESRSDVVLVADEPGAYGPSAPVPDPAPAPAANLRQSLDAIARNAGAIKAEQLRRKLDPPAKPSEPREKATNGDSVEA